MERGIITISENGAVTMPTAPVWMTQQEMSDAFNVFGCDIRRAIRAIYKLLCLHTLTAVNPRKE